jgi:hypothetical protein
MLDTPLIVIPGRDGNRLRDNDGHYIGAIDSDTHAAEVVKRCNAYPELVSILAELSDWVFWLENNENGLPAVYKEAAALLARIR